MKHIFKSSFFKITLLLGIVVSMGSCESTELEILDNPNALTPTNADVNLFLSSITVSSGTFFEQISEEGMELTRILHMFGPTYDTAYLPAQLNGPYSTAYSTILADVRAMQPVAEEQGLFTHNGIAMVIEAYIIATLVDYLGDIPYSEAVQGADSPNPNLDSGADIYAALQTLLDDAIVEFNRDEIALPGAEDVYYGGDESKWIQLANTLKLKLHLNTGNAAGINAALAAGVILDNADDWQFPYSTTDNNPDSRHPLFSRNFDNGTTDYMSNSYMWKFIYEKDVLDPRTRYYFYRQVDTYTTDPNEATCAGNLSGAPSHYNLTLYPFCAPFNYSPQDADFGFWGRDHGDPDGIPPDGNKRSTWGLYPVGGLFDDNSTMGITSRNISTLGAGISPLLLSSHTNFMLAEAALTLGTNGNARTYLEAGMRESFDKVINFKPEAIDGDRVVIEDDPDTPENEERTVADLYFATPADVDAYVADVLADYDSGSDDDKYGIIIDELYRATYGNGIEAYNAYRRSGQLENLQPTLEPNPGTFVLSFFYPSNLVNRNSNVSQKSGVDTPVFWDTNPNDVD